MLLPIALSHVQSSHAERSKSGNCVWRLRLKLSTKSYRSLSVFRIQWCNSCLPLSPCVLYNTRSELVPRSTFNRHVVVASLALVLALPVVVITEN